jgi:hypothetical protein
VCRLNFSYYFQPVAASTLASVAAAALLFWTVAFLSCGYAVGVRRGRARGRAAAKAAKVAEAAASDHKSTLPSRRPSSSRSASTARSPATSSSDSVPPSFYNYLPAARSDFPDPGATFRGDHRDPFARIRQRQVAAAGVGGFVLQPNFYETPTDDIEAEVNLFYFHSSYV